MVSWFFSVECVVYDLLQGYVSVMWLQVIGPSCHAVVPIQFAEDGAVVHYSIGWRDPHRRN
jgi:hypothetical protein